MRMTFHCILAFIYNILLLNNNLSANGEADELDAVLRGSFIINRETRRIGRTAYIGDTTNTPFIGCCNVAKR